MSPFEIAKPLTLPCGLTLPNRLVKAAMAEGWGDRDKLPHADLIKTYSLWAEGGWGMILTGNVQIDAVYLGTPEDNAVNNDIGRTRHIYVWEQWASAASGNGTAVIMQLNHPGRQSTIGAGTRSYLAKSIAPSAVPVVLGQGLIARAASAIVFGIPKEMSLPEIEDVVRRFADAARMAHEAGFAGVQVHAAHGYLLAQFLSSKTNKRTDAFGGTPRKRAKIVIDIIRAIRNVVPNTFCVGVKVNSVDHQSPGDLEDCLAQLKDVINTGIDFLEISGGTYENPLMMSSTADRDLTRNVSPSAAAREAFFIEFAKAVRRAFPSVHLVLTGGFRSRLAMEQAVCGPCDMVGIARPSVIDPRLPKSTILNVHVADHDAVLQTKSFSQAWLAKLLGVKGLGGGMETIGYTSEIHKMINVARI